MGVVIKVEDLGKSYIISHQGQSGYVALRDVIAEKVKDTFSKTKHLVTNTPIPKVVAKEEFWSLKDVSFEVNQSDRVGIIGRNGAGKSTLLKILSRITEPTLGRFSTKGRIASLLEVGTGFHPELTGRENIFLNGAVLGMHRAEIKKKFDEIVDFSEVEKFLDTPVKRYSSGMYVRLAFAVAAYLESEILVVDEVLAVGDLQFQKKCLGKMQDVSQSEGRTVLFVSHNMGTINQLCNKGILLKAGRISDMGSTGDIVRRYMKSGSTNGQIERSSVSGTLVPNINFSEISINGLHSNDIYISPSNELRIGLKGVCNHDMDYFRTGITILKDGIKLFSSHNHPEPQPIKKGKFQSEFFIPKYVLRPGDYSISIFGHDNGNNRKGTEWIYGNEVLTFTILEEWDTINDFNNEGIFNLPVEP
ncbi:MAG TPA: polysaccharide ABC transporter ATP-binding protein [Bacteroidales bacterium]|nr:polysaccharide ABC transporter ATP-binding protein [Bacteroidales bacterium]